MKKLAVMGIMLALAMSAGSCLAAGTNEVNVNVNSGTKVNVNVQEQTQGGVAWNNGSNASVTAREWGVPGDFVGAQGRIMARRAAVMACYRSLAEQLKGIQLDGDTTVAAAATQNDIINGKLSAVVKGARIVEEHQEPDGSYCVVMSIPMFGAGNSVAAAVLPEVMKNTPVAQPPITVTPKQSVLPKQEYKEAKKATYSGVIVDASGLGLECTMAPQIIDTNGRAIYGKENIDMSFAVSQGLVEYSHDLAKVAGGASRAGGNALVVRAQRVSGGTNSVNPVNVVVSPEDADKILLAVANNGEIFSRGAVVFVR